MRCPCCAAAELTHDTRDLPYVYKRHRLQYEPLQE